MPGRTPALNQICDGEKKNEPPGGGIGCPARPLAGWSEAREVEQVMMKPRAPQEPWTPLRHVHSGMNRYIRVSPGQILGVKVFKVTLAMFLPRSFRAVNVAIRLTCQINHTRPALAPFARLFLRRARPPQSSPSKVFHGVCEGEI